MTKIVMKDGNNSGRMEVGQGTRVGRRAALRTCSCVLKNAQGHARQARGWGLISDGGNSTCIPD